MKKLTKKQQQVLQFIHAEIEAGRPPCVREIAEHFRFQSTRAVCDHLDALEKKNCITREPGKARSIRIVGTKEEKPQETTAVRVLGDIPAGPPVEAEELDTRVMNIDTETLGFQPTDRTFALVVHGDSMVGRGVFDGDTVIIDGSREPRKGDIVAALIDNECTLKTLIEQHGRFFLKPENPDYDDLVPIMDLKIQGVARTLIRRLTT